MSRGPSIFLDKSKGHCSQGTRGVNLYIKIDRGERSFRGLKFVVWYLSKVWRYLSAIFRVFSVFTVTPLKKKKETIP